MTTLIARALEANERLMKEVIAEFIQHLRWEIEEMIGTTEYTIIETQRFIIIKAEDIVLRAVPNGDGEPELTLIKRCQKCGDLFGWQLEVNTLAMLGATIKEEGVCDCGTDEPTKPLDSESAESVIETWEKTMNERKAKGDRKWT